MQPAVRLQGDPAGEAGVTDGADVRSEVDVALEVLKHQQVRQVVVRKGSFLLDLLQKWLRMPSIRVGTTR